MTQLEIIETLCTIVELQSEIIKEQQSIIEQHGGELATNPKLAKLRELVAEKKKQVY